MRRPISVPPEIPGLTFVKLLGSGGFSDVFLYEQALPKRRVAVKVLLLDELTPENRAAFAAEANLMAQLSTHPYIVTIYHADVAAGDRPYFVMEFCSGPSLGERYRRSPLEVLDALRTGVRLSSAVHTAHLAGILHRDIKPANVLSNDYGWPALTDFGISSAVDDAIASHTTTTTAVAAAMEETGSTGTSGPVGLSVPWSPPEMFDDVADPDVRSDVFSLAATIWTVLAGQTPFEIAGRPNGPLDLIGRIERGAITPMTRTDVPASLTAVLRKGMSTRREERFSSALEFGRALQRVEMELGYARTELEVPNMYVDAPARAPEGDDADETRVRQVQTIEAQPLPPAAAPPIVSPPPGAMFVSPATPASVDPVEEDTVARPWGPGLSSPAPEAAASAAGPVLAETAPAAPARSRGGLVAGIVVGALALVVAVAVVVGVLVFGADADSEAKPTASTAPTGSAAVPTRIAPPEAASPPALDGSSVVFPVTNPDPQEGDAFVWRLANRPDQPGLRPIDGDTAIVDGYTEGTPLCIEVMVLRKGKTSEPLTTCFPPA
ncbi:serine/threonine-protein kinase [Salinibacterium sp. ZJ70]|uniref:serine/threonine-protein kinase n=1 Tax=Salinibacterium sp. ZJ70 TaxID=2708084 RepID=UPI00141E6972|nr:serine/threonine-protein kinase [Salinibacterium sp. ZJ70]